MRKKTIKRYFIAPLSCFSRMKCTALVLVNNKILKNWPLAGMVSNFSCNERSLMIRTTTSDTNQNLLFKLQVRKGGKIIFLFPANVSASSVDGNKNIICQSHSKNVFMRTFIVFVSLDPQN